MSIPVTATTDDDDVILRFLEAAEERLLAYDNRVPLNKKEARLAIAWLRACVGKINEDGSLAA